MVNELKTAVRQIKSNSNTEIVVGCGIRAYKELQNELSLTDDQPIILHDGTQIYCLEWYPADKIVIGGLEILKKPDWLIPNLEEYTMANNLLPVVTETAMKIQKEVRESTENYIVKTCLDLHIDPDILKRQSDELVKQKNLIENTAEMLKNGKLLRRPCALGTTVYIVENCKMYQGSVIRFEQVLSPKRDIELLFADIELYEMNTIVHRCFSEFGTSIFVDAEDANNKLREQISNK